LSEDFEDEEEGDFADTCPQIPPMKHEIKDAETSRTEIYQ